MTDVAVTRSSSTPKQQQKPGRAQPQTEDVRAMSDAFARARGEPRGLPGQLGQGQAQAKGPQAPLQQAQAQVDPRAELARVAGWRAADERGTVDRREAERGGEQALGLVSPSHAPATPPAALNPPPPHVDPSGFAQMLADLWTRENGRGDKRVQVSFGHEAWPATGAMLVQNADGVLDVTIDMAPGGADASTDALAAAFGGAGLSVGRVETATAIS